MLLATATLRAISQARPDLKLDFVVSDWARPALDGNRRLRQLVPTGATGSGLSLGQYWRLIGRLRRQKYAAALVLDRSPRLTILPWLAGIGLRAGLDNLGRGFALNVRATQPPTLRHEAHVYLDVARVLGVPVAQARLEYDVPPTAQASFEALAARLGLDLSSPIAIIHPGGGQNPDTRVPSKRWLPARFGEIAARLVERGYRVMIIGAKDDQFAAREVCAAAQTNLSANEVGQVVDLSGQFSIAESGALLQKADLFIGNDTGLMHLAVACGLPTVAVFGPSSPVAYGPYTERGRAVGPLETTVAAGLPLKEYETLSLAEGGIERVSVEAVWQAVLAVID